jgi:hypothetical protein
MVAILILVTAFLLSFLIVHTRPLSEDEVQELASKRRNRAINNYFRWSRHFTTVNGDFKSRMRGSGAVHFVEERIEILPSMVAALLKGKKHEWILFAFVRGQSSVSIYFNKGPDRTAVSSRLSGQEFDRLIREARADTVLCFHNHPNAVLLPSEADLKSARLLASKLKGENLNLFEFVCGRGMFHEYHRSVADSFLPVAGFRQKLAQENGQARLLNLALHLERLVG